MAVKNTSETYGIDARSIISQPKAGISDSELSNLFARLPTLTEKALDDFANDIAEIRQQTQLSIDEWD